MVRVAFRICALAFILIAGQLRAATVALVGGRLIDGFGGPPLANSVILIEGDRIKAVGQVGKLAVPDGAEVISTEGMSVLPGLWDMHVHLMIVGHGDVYRQGMADWHAIIDGLAKPTFDGVLALSDLAGAVTDARDAAVPDPRQAALKRKIAEIRARATAGAYATVP